MLFIDIGVNLSSNQFERDRDDVIDRARKARISAMIVTGTDLDASEKAQQYSQQFPGYIYSTAGIHPHHAKDFNEQTIDQLLHLHQRPGVVAVGECGLDYFRNFSEPAIQRECFQAQLVLATEIQKPVFLHQRDAHGDFIKLLSASMNEIPAAVVHCFTGSREEMLAYLEMGLYIGVTGWVCDERRGKELKSMINQIPLDRLMLETDAPYLLPRDLKPKPASKRNEPAFLPHIAQTIADCYGMALDELAEIVTDNTRRFFQLD